MRNTSKLALVVALALAELAWAAPPASPIALGDLPGSSGKWQQGTSTIAAPVGDVREWMTDFARWPDRFGDITSARVLGQADGVTTVRFHSQIIGRDMTLKLRVAGNSVTYDGTGKDVTTQGKIFMRPIDANHTEVILQGSTEVHGALGAFATQGLKRKRTFAKMQSDLRALQSLAAGADDGKTRS